MSLRPINEHPAYSLAARNIALRQERDELRAKYDALVAEVRRLSTEDYFFLDDTGRRLARYPAITAVLKGPSEAQENEREGQMLAEQWREHEEQTRP